MIERDCNTCKHHVQGHPTASSCWECMIHNGMVYLPDWEPAYVMVEEAPVADRKEVSDGSTADYYKLPPLATQLQDLIAFRNMNAQIGEIFRACYRLGHVAHSPQIRDVKKIIFYAQAELNRLEKYCK